MSIATMNWALRQRLATTQQQILLYVIADSADPNGVTRHCDPSYMEEHARMTRATMFRRLGELEELGLLRRAKFYSERGAPIYEIQLVLSALIDIPIRRRRLADEEAGEDEHDGGSEAATSTPESQAETLGESHAATLVPTKVSPSAAAQSHSCDCISPPVSKNLPPNPPPGGLRSKNEAEVSAKREALWQRFLAYPSIATMDQAEARAELDALSIEDAEWAVSVVPGLKEELRKAKDRPPKNAHLWLRKAMFKNFPRGKLEGPPPEGVWIVEGSDEDRALKFVRHLARQPLPFVRARTDGSRGYLHKTEVGPDLLAMLAFASDVPLRWPAWTRGTPEFAAWQHRLSDWIDKPLPLDPGTETIRAPCRWPPKKDGTIYADNSDIPSSEGSSS